jgi:IS4 transposase
VVAVKNEETDEHPADSTNIDPHVLTAEQVAGLYRARWQVDLIFNELKSRYALDKINTKTRHAVEGLVWAALLNLLASRRIYRLALANAEPEDRPRFTTLRWATVWLENAPDLLREILMYNGIEPGVGLSMEVYASQRSIRR